MQNINKDIASIILAYTDYFRYGKFFDALYPGARQQCYNINIVCTVDNNTVKYKLFNKYHREDGAAYMSTSSNNTKWYFGGYLHRLDGPANTYCCVGSKTIIKEWWAHGELHRKDGPAIEWSNGTQKWYYYGNLHRKGGPAVTLANGIKKWYYFGQLHRRDGPALEGHYGDEWYIRGKLHRKHLPAIIYYDIRCKMWYNYGKFIREAYY
jgi:hypothetical protein